MSDRRHDIPRPTMTLAERRGRSELAQLIHERGLLRGSLSVRRRTCGKKGCRCARGELHEGLYLVATEGGRIRQLYIPKAFESLVRQWVADYQRGRRLLEEISRLYWERVRKRQG